MVSQWALRGVCALLLVMPSFSMSSARPPVDDPVTLSAAGKIWRTPGVDVAWNFKDKVFLSVWHEGVVFDDPPYNHGHPPHHWLTASRVRGRAVRVSSLGVISFGSVGDLGPATAGFAAFAPRVKYNPKTNDFLVVWAEGKWEARDGIDGDGDGLPDFLPGFVDPDISIFGDSVTDLDANLHGEFAYSQDPFPPNSRIVARRVKADAVTLNVTIVGAAIEVSMGVGGVPGNPSGVPGGAQDPLAIHPAILPDVSWDGHQMVIVWQTLENPQLGALETVGATIQMRHIFRTSSRVRSRRFNETGAPQSGFVDLSNAKERFFIKGPTSNLANIVDGSIPSNLMNELVYKSVPTDPMPRIASLILQGADGIMGSADDVFVGSLITWSVTTLVFNEPKSRVRGRFLPAGTGNAGIVWDIFSTQGQIVQRASVTAAPTRDADDPSTPDDEMRTLSNFLVTFQGVDDIVKEGGWAVEYVGAIRARMAEETGKPSGPVIDVAIPDVNQTFLSPTATWCYETEQFLVSWTRTDTDLWNPYTYGRSWYPKAWAFFDNPINPPPGPLLAGIASLYPCAAAMSYSGVIDPATPYSSFSHTLYAGQEDDFGANFVGLYRFPNPQLALESASLAVGPATLDFSTPSQSTTPAPKSVTVQNDTTGNSVLVWDVESDQSWLSVSPASGQLLSGQSASVSLSANPGGLPNGTYIAQATFTSPTAEQSPQSVTVTLVVGKPSDDKGIVKGAVEKEGGGGGGCGGSVVSTGTGGWAGWLLAICGLAMLVLARRSRLRWILPAIGRRRG